jgi:hypothetical protein
LTNGTGWSADYTYNVDVLVPAGATTGTSVPTTADTIDEVTKTLALPLEASATGTIIDNNNALLWQRSLLLRLLKELMWYQLYIKQPF